MFLNKYQNIREDMKLEVRIGLSPKSLGISYRNVRSFEKVLLLSNGLEVAIKKGKEENADNAFVSFYSHSAGK